MYHHAENTTTSTTTSASSTSEEYPATRTAVAILVSTALFVLAQLYASIPLLAPVSSAFRANATFALSLCFSLAYAVGFLIWGPVSDRYGRKRVIVISLSVLTLTTLGCAFAPTLGVLAILRACQGMAAAGFAPVALAYLTESVLPAGRAQAIGAMSTAFLAAGIFGQVFASIIALSLGWRWFFGVCGLIFIGTVSLVLCTMLDRTQAGQTISLWKQYVTLGSLCIKPIFLFYGLAHVTLLLAFVALYTGLGRHLETLGVAASGIVWVRLAAFPTMLISLYAGSYAKKYGVLRVAQLGYVLSVLGLLGGVLCAQVLAGIVICSLIYVAGVALAIPSMITLYGDAAAPHRASGMALNGFVLFVGASLGPVIGALPLAFTTLMLLLVGFLILALLSLAAASRINNRLV